MMTTDRLRSDLLERARLAGPPSRDLAEQVLDRRRQGDRQRLTVIGAVLAVALVVGGLPFALSAIRGDRGATAAVVTAATRGSLAGNSSFLTGLQTVPWRWSEDYDGVRSPAAVAGETAPVQGPEGSTYAAGDDIAARIPAGQRRVVFAGDVPGGRWALLAIPLAEGYAAAWFTGAEGSPAGEMSMSGPAQLVRADEPLAHVDRANPSKTLVVVAAPGDTVLISPQADLSETGMYFRTSTIAESTDGIVVHTLDTSLRYGVPASVVVERDGLSVFDATPTSVGVPAEAATPDPPGWATGDPETPRIVGTRGGGGYTTPRPLADALLTLAIGPTGLTLQTIPPEGSQITELFSGDLTGPAAADPVEPAPGSPRLTVWSIDVPTGAVVVVGGWWRYDTTGRLDYAATLLTVATAEPAGTTVTNRMRIPASQGLPASDYLVIAGPENAVRATVTSSGGAVEVPLTTGAAVIPTPPGPGGIRLFTADGTALPATLSDSQDLTDPADTDTTLLAGIE